MYLYEEDERLAYAALTAFRRNLLGLPFLSNWTTQLAQSAGLPWHLDTFYTPEQTICYHNLKTFLWSLYFQLHLASPAPQVARELLALLEKAMDRGYYVLH